MMRWHRCVERWFRRRTLPSPVVTPALDVAAAEISRLAGGPVVAGFISAAGTLLELNDGRVVRLEDYTTRADLRDAGVGRVIHLDDYRKDPTL